MESRSLSVLWGTVPCPHQGGPITGYRLRYVYSNGSDSYTVNLAGECNTQYNLTGLTPFTNYSVQVAAVNDRGTGPYSTPLIVETLQDGGLRLFVYVTIISLIHLLHVCYTVPGPVFSLSVISEGVLLNILWSHPTEPNGVITTYEVCSNVSGVFSYTNTSATQHTLRDLPPNTVVIYIQCQSIHLHRTRRVCDRSNNYWTCP